ncbi:flavin containing amine oxidoreductase [Fragilaria crotonensis]|nr:flavin containing amine oxidoreductase [Fragilaria crotonensis]
MELLYYYALAHQDSFDVRWIRNGTVSDSLIAPMAEKLQSDYDLKVMGGCRVGKISLDSVDGQKLSVSSVEYTTMSGQKEVIDNVDGIVLALGCKGLEAVVNASPDLAKLPAFSAAASLKGIDVISVRLWLDKVVPTRTPANVFSRFDELRGAGGTFFMLDQLQDNNEALWGGEKPQGSVLGCDFYNAGGLLSLSDEDLVSILMEDLLPSAVPQFANAKVVDSWVGKFPGTVSWFAPGSFLKRPPTEGAGPVLPTVKFAGDLVRMGDREHGAKGLCQERAFVSGFEAANSLLRSTVSNFNMHPVLAVREDEPLFKAAVTINRGVMNYLPRFWVR